MGLSHSPKIVTNGLVLCLDAANTKSYPGSGTTWYDLSGNGNHATLVASPVFSGGTVTFNGTTQYATITSNQTSLDFSSEQTVSMWLYHTFISGRRNPWNQAYAGYGAWTCESGSSMNSYWGTHGGTGTPYTNLGSGSISRSVWNHITFTRNATNAFWYINGVQTATKANPYGVLPTNTTANITIGNGYSGFWDGQMGSVNAYTRALSAAEVQQNFNAVRGRFGI